MGTPQHYTTIAVKNVDIINLIVTVPESVSFFPSKNESKNAFASKEHIKEAKGFIAIIPER